MTSNISIASLQKDPAVITTIGTGYFKDDGNITSYNDLIAKHGTAEYSTGPSFTKRALDDNHHFIGRFRAGIGIKLNRIAARTARHVFASLAENDTSVPRVKITAGYVCDNGIVSEETLMVGGTFIAVIEIMDWRLIE